MNYARITLVGCSGTNINQLNYYGKETNIEGLHEREF